jgi:hypothetical protein
MGVGGRSGTGRPLFLYLLRVLTQSNKETGTKLNKQLPCHEKLVMILLIQGACEHIS